MTTIISNSGICNLALDYLGERGNVSDIENPTTDEEIVMARHYDTVRRGLLREYIWNFAKKRATISRTGTPSFDYADEYLLPADCVRLLSISNSDVSYQSLRRDYDIEERKLLINASGAVSLRVRYIYDHTDVSKWDSLFLRLMALYLAEAVAYKFTLKKGVTEQINGMIAQLIPKTVSIDGQERPPRRIQRSKYISARRNSLYQVSVASPYTVFDE